MKESLDLEKVISHYLALFLFSRLHSPNIFSFLLFPMLAFLSPITSSTFGFHGVLNVIIKLTISSSSINLNNYHINGLSMKPRWYYLVIECIVSKYCLCYLSSLWKQHHCFVIVVVICILSNKQHDLLTDNVQF